MRFNPVIRHYNVIAPASASDAPSMLAFSFAKAGSTLLYDILSYLSPHVGLTYFSVDDQLFAANVHPNARPGNIGSVFKDTGYCYGGFRQFPIFPVPILHSSRVVFLVRDPRDMVVSLYFSLLKSHVLPEGQEPAGARAAMEKARGELEEKGVDLFARESITNYVKMFEGYTAQGFHWRPNIAVYRYEDVIFNKAAWIADMCSWYNWSVDPSVIDWIVQKVDIRVDEERPAEHIRQVAPGNHKKYLTERTLVNFEQRLGEYMRIYGYSTAG